MRNFNNFLNRKQRLNKHHLKILGEVLGRCGFIVRNHLNHHEDPYIYVEKPVEYDRILEDLEFGGIRIYTRGTNIISFRPQNKENVEPFGTAYLLDVKGMYKDLMHKSQDVEAGKDLIKYIVEEVLNFFIFCAKAQKEENDEIDGLGQIINAKSSVNDYANQSSGDLRRNN